MMFFRLLAVARSRVKVLYLEKNVASNQVEVNWTVWRGRREYVLKYFDLCYCSRRMRIFSMFWKILTSTPLFEICSFFHLYFHHYLLLYFQLNSIKDNTIQSDSLCEIEVTIIISLQTRSAVIIIWLIVTRTTFDTTEKIQSAVT